MTAPLNLLGKWKILETIMRDLSLARNDLIVSQDLLDHYHDKVGGSRSSTRVIATRTGLARSRVSDCLNRLINAGHFTVAAVRPGGSKAKVYAPCRQEGGPAHGASSAEHGPVHGSTKSPGGPAHGASSGPAHGSTNAASGPAGGSDKTLREPCLAPRKSKGSHLGPTSDAAHNPSPASGAPGCAPPVEPNPAETMASRRLDAAIAAFDLFMSGHEGVGSFSVNDLRVAHNCVFCGEDLCFDAEGLAEYATLNLCWARLVAALENGDPWATTWINFAVAADRDADAADRDNVEYDYDRLVEIEKALKAGEAPSAA